MNDIIQVITGAVGSVGFGLIFNLRKKYILQAAAGGFLSWAIYLFCSQYVHNGIFLSTLAASFGTAVYTEILARVCKAPSTIFFITSVIPLIPGKTLYYCMNAIVLNNYVQAKEYGTITFLYSVAIAAGMTMAWVLCDFSRKMHRQLRS
ncbi:MAG: threonine/serine exporter family protein [Lachnospiraceae bacterium]|nr:threonine/serine exporter family protein [Lachnospiraceae bacterium]